MERKLFQSRAKAQAAILAGKVKLVGCERPTAGKQVAEDALVHLEPDPVPFVSRGGLKLAAALDAFGVNPAGRTALDLGASTGGFTDCLLKRGALRVWAVDVGRSQLDASLRSDPRVANLERTHARELAPDRLGPPPERPDLAVVDVSFISLAKVLAYIAPCLKPPFEILALVKPQF
ncbi:MAG: TlyA family RNA methyltransferase, partial [Elusimicrobiota bacterium]